MAGQYYSAINRTMANKKKGSAYALPFVFLIYRTEITRFLAQIGA
ncbi:hypothetical protein [Vibrio vulnificus YJ016]|uniref:Uncharacterized protein n=1 Tax=Vibrio vulnificus (strain YJ016) TaxID=196600 RepID=Q7MLH5_VIBVY|nr:hypothetical protein VVMO6_01764 [Vibrio vulnificus MO6-24/O]BAC94216.1 hypothetical protein [Vibrio vulnificus YJ016]